jgi:hypothetical protein
MRTSLVSRAGEMPAAIRDATLPESPIGTDAPEGGQAVIINRSAEDAAELHQNSRHILDAGAKE